MWLYAHLITASESVSQIHLRRGGKALTWSIVECCLKRPTNLSLSGGIACRKWSRIKEHSLRLAQVGSVLAFTYLTFLLQTRSVLLYWQTSGLIRTSLRNRFAGVEIQHPVRTWHRTRKCCNWYKRPIYSLAGSSQPCSWTAASYLNDVNNEWWLTLLPEAMLSKCWPLANCCTFDIDFGVQRSTAAHWC